MSQNQFNQPIGHPLPNWKPCPRPPHTPLHGRYCTLAPLNIPTHSKPLYVSLMTNNRGELWTYLPYGPFETYKDFHEWLTVSSSMNDPLFYTILNLEDLPIGLASYLRIDQEHGAVEVGHLQYSSLLKRTIAATEAMYLMMKHAFDDLGYRRYEWKCNALNEPSMAAARRLGFQFEGIFRQDKVYKGQNRDTAWFSILDSEWSNLKHKFENWLDEANFGGEGRQIRKLSIY